ncbi:MAG TPA: hypothetical protein VMW41_02195 [Candidatus Bathyarchaeia archaeon]|nr:hypothetical protein [Candidatus Bathyarchaeia archaeon]
MKLSLPNLNQFFDEVDPEKTIDRAKALTDISLVVILQALVEVRGKLSENRKAELDQILQNDKGLDMDKIYTWFKRIRKRKDLFTAINNQIEKVRIDYMQTHLKAMPAEKRKKVIDRFPALESFASV